jgi:signal transduction histidine kinase
MPSRGTKGAAEKPRMSHSWLSGHKQAVAYGLIAFSMAVLVGATTAGALFLHRAAELERQTQRTQRLGGLGFQLHDVAFHAEAAGGVSPSLARDRKRAVAAANDALQLVERHDPHAGRRLRPSYVAYLGGSKRELDAAAANAGVIPAPLHHRVERELARFESRVDAEVRRQTDEARVTNPRARLALILAAVAAGFLVAFLFWQFEMQRRAGKIDRDNVERSEELMRQKEDFAAAVSHELRTPLTSILGYLELIEQSNAERSEPEGGYLVVVKRNAERLLRLVSDLLLVSEVEDSMLALDFQDVDLHRLASECVEAAKPAADAKGIELRLRDGAPVHLGGDRGRLAQMMDNLVSNAIKFTSDGGTVTISTAVREGQGVFEVADSGMGISAADQAQLYDRFFRTRDAAANAIAGTGLGLTITKAIVDAHGGSIDLQSTVGQGTTFVVTLPLAEAAAPVTSLRS